MDADTTSFFEGARQQLWDITLWELVGGIEPRFGLDEGFGFDPALHSRQLAEYFTQLLFESGSSLIVVTVYRWLFPAGVCTDSAAALALIDPRAGTCRLFAFGPGYPAIRWIEPLAGEALRHRRETLLLDAEQAASGEGAADLSFDERDENRPNELDEPLD